LRCPLLRVSLGGAKRTTRPASAQAFNATRARSLSLGARTCPPISASPSFDGSVRGGLAHQTAFCRVCDPRRDPLLRSGSFRGTVYSPVACRCTGAFTAPANRNSPPRAPVVGSSCFSNRSPPQPLP
jgi:hypothetical protein